MVTARAHEICMLLGATLLACMLPVIAAGEDDRPSGAVNTIATSLAQAEAAFDRGDLVDRRARVCGRYSPPIPASRVRCSAWRNFDATTRVPPSHCCSSTCVSSPPTRGVTSRWPMPLRGRARPTCSSGVQQRACSGAGGPRHPTRTSSPARASGPHERSDRSVRDVAGRQSRGCRSLA